MIKTKMKIKTILILFLLDFFATNAQKSPLLNTKPSIVTADSFFLARNWKQAKQIYEAVLNDTTKNSLAWNRLGFSNYNLKLYDAALKCFQKSIAQNPQPVLRGIVYSRIARIYAVKNDKLNTFSALDSAVVYSYTNVAEMDTLTEYNNFRNEKYFKHLREQVYINGNPCMTDAHAREFDFWVGEWDVHPTGTNQVTGARSLIQIISGGCAILENWESPASNGKSINFIDPVTNKWKQSWAGNYANGIQEFVNGEYKDGAMRFTFETTNAQGNKIIGRFVFFNEGPNQVRQFNETSADGGKTWTTSYDLTYVRKK